MALAPYEAAEAGAPDLVIDLSGDGPAGEDGAVWRLDVDGVPGEAGLLASLFTGRIPVAALRDGQGAAVAAGRLGAESQTVMLVAFEDYLARTITLIEAALSGGASATCRRGRWRPSSRRAPSTSPGGPSGAGRRRISAGGSPGGSTACASTGSAGGSAGAGRRGRT